MLLLYYEMEKYDERYSFYFQTKKLLPIPMAEAPIIIDSHEHPINDMYVRITER